MDPHSSDSTDVVPTPGQVFADQPTEPPLPSSWRAWFTVSILVGIYLNSFLDRQIMGLLVEDIKASLDVSDFKMGLLGGIAFAFFYATAGLPIGYLVDRTTRTRIVIIGQIFWTIASFSCGLATRYWQLFMFRFGVGVGEATKNAKLLASVVEELGVITGQKAMVTRARRSISNFHLREGMPIGATVTLRRRRMYEFLDRLVSVAIPRVRDFRGLRTRSFDGRGNFTMGVREQIIFPEIDFDKVGQIHGMDITVVTSTNKDDEALALLRAMGFPFRGEIPVIIEHNAN